MLLQLIAPKPQHYKVAKALEEVQNVRSMSWFIYVDFVKIGETAGLLCGRQARPGQEECA